MTRWLLTWSISGLLLVTAVFLFGCTPCQDESSLPGCPIFPNAAPRQ
jgi:hypothetical protein